METRRRREQHRQHNNPAQRPHLRSTFSHTPSNQAPPAPKLAGGDAERDQLQFETLTFVPFDRRLVVAAMLSPGERDWLNSYHAEVLAKLAPRLSPAAHDWCQAACAAI